MLEFKKNRISVVNTGMSDVSLDETLSSHKLENGKYTAENMKNMPSLFRSVANNFLVTDGVTFITDPAKKNEVSHMILWDYKQEPLGIYKKTQKKKKELFVSVDVETFKSDNNFEVGVDRTILSVVAKEMLMFAAKDKGKVLYRGDNAAALKKASYDGAIIFKDGAVDSILVNEETEKSVTEMMQQIYSSLEPAETEFFDELISGKFNKERTMASSSIILKELKSSNLHKADLGAYISFSPATFATLEKDASKVEDPNFRSRVQFVQKAVSKTELAGLKTRTNLGGYATVVVPALANESAIFDMRMIPTLSAFDKNENFPKESQMIPLRKEMKALLKKSSENKAAIPELKKKYIEMFDEVMPEFMDKKSIQRFKGRLETEPNLIENNAFLSEVTNEAILAEKADMVGGYDALYSIKLTKDAKRPILGENGLPYDMAMKLARHDDFSTIFTASAREDIKKKIYGDDPTIEATTSYIVTQIQDNHQLISLQKKGTIPERIAYLVQDLQKMNEQGAYEYSYKKDGEEIIAEKSVDAVGHVQKIINTLNKELELKTNIGVAQALKSLTEKLSGALASEDVIREVKSVIESKDELYSPVIESASRVHSSSALKSQNQGYISHLYKDNINASMEAIYEAVENGQHEDIDYIKFVPKASSESEKTSHRKAMYSLLLGVISNIEFVNSTKKEIEKQVEKLPAYVNYLEKCKTNKKEPATNIVGFHPKTQEAKQTLSALENRIKGHLSPYNKYNIVNSAESLFLKDGKITKNGVEYNAKIVNSFAEISENIKEAKNGYVDRVKQEQKEKPSIVLAVIESLKSKTSENKEAIGQTIMQAISSEQTNDESAMSIIQSMISTQKEPEETVAPEVMAEVEAAAANLPESEPAVTIHEEEQSEMDMLFDEEIEDEIFNMLGREDDDIDVLDIAFEDELEEDEAEMAFGIK